MPEFRLFAADTEARFHILGDVRPVGYEVDVGIPGPPVYPRHVAIQRPAGFEVLGNVHRRQDIGQRHTPHHPTLPIGVAADAEAVDIAPQVAGQRLHFAIHAGISGEAGRFHRFGPTTVAPPATNS